MKAIVRATTAFSATALVSLLTVFAPASVLCGQTAPGRPDSTALYAEAQRLFLRADTLAGGSVSDRQMALDLLRQAIELYSKGGSRRDAAETLIILGGLYRQGGQPDSAMVYLRHALPLARGINDQRVEARALNRIGAVFGGIGRQDSAVTYFRRALPIARAVNDRTGEADALSEIGLVFRRTGQVDSALAYYRQALSIRRAVGDRVEEGVVLNNIGSAFRYASQSDSALSYYRQALPLRRAVGDRIGEAVTLNNIGTVFSDLAESDSALAYYRKALPIRRAMGNRPGEGVTLGNIGQVFDDLGQQDSALAYYRQALSISRAVGNRTGEAIDLNKIGQVFRRLGQPDSALAYHRQALPIRRAVRDPTGEATTLSNIGQVFDDIAQQDSSLSYYRQAMARGVADRAGQARTLNNIGSVFRRVGEPDSALTYYRQALPILQATKDRAAEASTLGSVGVVYRSVGRLDSALTYFDRSTAMSTSISKRSGSDFNRLSYNETTAGTYSLWTLAWLALSRHGGGDKDTTVKVDGPSAAYGALAALERGRAQALLDLMKDTTSHLDPGANFPAEGARLGAALGRANSAGLVYFSTGDTLIAWVISSSGKVNVFRRAIARDTLAALVGAFRDSSGVESGSARLALRGVALEAGTRRAVGTGARSSWSRRAEGLASILLPPEMLQQLDAEKEVVIIPQGMLALVPFAALPVGKTGEPFGAKLAIRYAPSLGTLGQAEDRSGAARGEVRDRTLRHALVVGNPTMPQVSVSDGSRDRLASLPGAETESRGIATLVGTEALTGAVATESEVVRRLAGATLVHLATHGFAYSSEAQARSSFVALAPDSLNDGLLTVGDILGASGLKLTADLVVLSACQTALGDLKQAEGTVGLQRAFLAKGARSVLVSLWNVSDAATQKLMTGFYKHWLRDPDRPSKAEALRRSQEDVRKTPGFEHPRFWAAFQLAGAS